MKTNSLRNGKFKPILYCYKEYFFYISYRPVPSPPLFPSGFPFEAGGTFERIKNKKVREMFFSFLFLFPFLGGASRHFGRETQSPLLPLARWRYKTKNKSTNAQWSLTRAGSMLMCCCRGSLFTTPHSSLLSLLKYDSPLIRHGV